MFPLGDVPIQISLVKVPTTPQPQVARLRNAQATLPHPQQQYNSTNRKVLTHYHNMQRALHLLGAGIGPLCRSKPLLTVEILRLSRTRGRPHFHYRHHDPRPRAAPMYAKGHESSTDADADVSVSSAAAAVAPPQPAHKPNIRYCQSCGGPTNHVVPNGEEKVRAVCTLCGKIHYENPKMVVGCLVEHDGKVLLCKRSIEPSYGLWTLPAGYLEIGESATEGAIRETMEEACAHVEVVSPFAQLDIPRIGQYRVMSFFEQN